MTRKRSASSGIPASSHASSGHQLGEDRTTGSPSPTLSTSTARDPPTDTSRGTTSVRLGSLLTTGPIQSRPSALPAGRTVPWMNRIGRSGMLGTALGRVIGVDRQVRGARCRARVGLLVPRSDSLTSARAQAEALRAHSVSLTSRQVAFNCSELSVQRPSRRPRFLLGPPPLWRSTQRRPVGRTTSRRMPRSCLETCSQTWPTRTSDTEGFCHNTIAMPLRSQCLTPIRCGRTADNLGDDVPRHPDRRWARRTCPQCEHRS